MACSGGPEETTTGAVRQRTMSVRVGFGPEVVILTGAGISAESGIKTFRACDGLWEEHMVEDVATPEGYARDPELVQRFYNARRHQLQRAEIHPNPAHYALARLERLLPGRVMDKILQG